MRAVKRVIREVSISLAESIPSAMTARLPDSIPTIIFRIERKALPITPTQAAVINQDAAGTEMDIAIDSRHDIQAETDLENNSPLTHRVTPTSARSSQFYLGGDLRASDSSNTFVVASATIHNVTIGASYGTSNVEEDINGGGFSVVISSGGTTAALNGGVALSVSDTVVLRHTVNESPDPNFVEIDDGTSDVAYGAFSA